YDIDGNSAFIAAAEVPLEVMNFVEANDHGSIPKRVLRRWCELGGYDGWFSTEDYDLTYDPKDDLDHFTDAIDILCCERLIIYFMFGGNREL
ncbi:hypothetical protein HDU79_002178, partial [Rhizoclosmatium sp. JEL0117]